MKEELTRREFVGGGIALIASAFLGAEPVSAAAAQTTQQSVDHAPAKEVDPLTLEYGFLLDRVPRYYRPSTTRDSGLIFRKGDLLRYIPEGSDWAQIVPDRYYNPNTKPQGSGYYVPRAFLDPLDLSSMQPEELKSGEKRWIEVDISNGQHLWAYSRIEGGPKELVLESKVSSGIPGKDTNVGNHHIFRKRWTRRMAGPGWEYYGVPFTQYFYESGEALHEAYWHNNFGHKMSHGCVNLPHDVAKRLYTWTTPNHTTFAVDDALPSNQQPGTPVFVRYGKPNIDLR